MGDRARTTIRPGQEFRHLLVEEEIGRGAFGHVYRARDTLVGRDVALKVVELKTAAAQDGPLREAQLLGSILHPNVVTLFGANALDHDVVLEMEFVDGMSLGEHLELQPDYVRAEAVRLVRGIMLGLRAAHESGIVHGDIKPSNVLLSVEGWLKVTDFGLGLPLGEVALEQGRMRGTPLYMAPEMIEGGGPSIASDLWAVGVVGYQLATGRHPFPADDLEHLYFRIVHEAAPPVPKSVPNNLRQLIEQCLAKSPHRRPASVVEALEVLAGSSPRAETAGQQEMIGRESESAVIDHLLREVAQRRTGLLTVYGSEGQGKTTLLVAARGAARAGGFAVYSLRAAGLLGPFEQLLAQVYDQSQPRHQGPDELAWRAFEALAERAGERPVFVTCDEVESWRERDLRSLAGVLKQCAGLPVGIAVAANENNPALDSLSAVCTHHIELKPLGAGPIRSIVTRHLAKFAVAPSQHREIYRYSGGNPMVALERARQLVVQQPSEADDLPSRAQAMAERRLRALSEADRELVDLAAVSGFEVQSRVLAAVAKRSHVDILRALQRILRAHGMFVAREHGIEFESQALYETVLGAMAPSLLASLHEEFATSLRREAGLGATPEQIGRHLHAAGQIELASPHLLVAAREAMEAQRHDAGVELVRMAVGRMTQVTPENLANVAETMFLAAGALSDTGRTAEAVEILDEIEAAARSVDDAETGLRCHVWRASTTYWTRGAASIDRQSLESAVRSLPDCRERARACYLLALIDLRRGEADAAEAGLQRAGVIAQSAGSRVVLAAVHHSLGHVAKESGKFEEAAVAYAEAEEAARSIGAFGNAAISGLLGMVTRAELGDVSTLASKASSAAEVLTVLGDDNRAGHARIYALEACRAEGRWIEALDHGRAALEQIHAEAYPAGRVAALLHVSELCVIQGRLEDARRWIEEAEVLLRSSGENTQILPLCFAQLFLSSRDQVELALPDFGDAVKSLTPRAVEDAATRMTELRVWGALTEVWLPLASRLEGEGRCTTALTSLDLGKLAGRRKARSLLGNRPSAWRRAERAYLSRCLASESGPTPWLRISAGVVPATLVDEV